MDVALTLRSAREASGLTQAELAARARTTQSVVARAERAGSNPTLATYDRLLRAAGHMLTVTPSPKPAAHASVDESQLRERLALTPAARLQLFQRSHRNLAMLSSGARRVVP